MPGGGEHGSQPGCRCGPHLRSQGVSATEPGLEEAATLPMPEQLRAAALARRPRGSISARPHTGRQSAHVQRHRRGTHSPTARETRATPRARKASLSTSPGSTTPQPPAACRLIIASRTSRAIKAHLQYDRSRSRLSQPLRAWPMPWASPTTTRPAAALPRVFAPRMTQLNRGEETSAHVGLRVLLGTQDMRRRK
jgi:hypothetical protein